MVVYSDSDWAGEKDNRVSVRGFIVFLLDVPIMWRLQVQKLVSLSTMEAE